MTTLDGLERSGVITKIEIRLNRRENADRVFYGSRNFIIWAQKIFSDNNDGLINELTLREQLDGIFRQFITGKQLKFPRDYHPLHPHKNAVWELKSPDLRVFGWFPLTDHFIAVYGDYANHIKQHNLYHGYCNQVIDFRKSIGCSDSLCVREVDFDDVISI